MMALGPLGLSHEALWSITYGQLLDLIISYNYAQFLKRQENANLAVCIGAAMSGCINDINDLTGYWVDGEILNQNEYNEHIIKTSRGESQ